MMDSWMKKEIIEKILKNCHSYEQAELIFSSIKLYLGESGPDGRHYVHHVGDCYHCGKDKSVCSAIQCETSNRWQVFCGACGSSSGSTRTYFEAVELWNKRG